MAAPEDRRRRDAGDGAVVHARARHGQRTDRAPRVHGEAEDELEVHVHLGCVCSYFIFHVYAVLIHIYIYIYTHTYVSNNL